MSDELTTIRKFLDPGAAASFVKLLESHEIPFYVEDASETFDPSFAFNKVTKEIHVKVRPSDFERIESLVEEQVEELTEGEIPSDHYLLEFNDEELFELLSKPDEWSAMDYQLAQRILKDRGKPVDDELLGELKARRKEELATPSSSPKAWIYAGYLGGPFGGLVGFFVGWHMLTFKKTLPDGTQVPGYTGHDRMHGLFILVLGILFTLAYLVLVLWKEVPFFR